MFNSSKQSMYTIVKEFGPIDLPTLLKVIECKYGAEKSVSAYLDLVVEKELDVNLDGRVVLYNDV